MIFSTFHFTTMGLARKTNAGALKAETQGLVFMHLVQVMEKKHFVLLKTTINAKMSLFKNEQMLES